MTYQDYLNSPDWHQKRRQKLRKGPANRRCAICGSTQRLQVHHVIYRADLTKTRQSELRVLCRRCHFVTHRLVDSGVLRLTTTNVKARFAQTKAAVSEALGLSPSRPIRPRQPTTLIVTAAPSPPFSAAAVPPPGSWQDRDTPLLDRLRAVRLAIAIQRGVPPFVICHDRTLREMAQCRPLSLSSLVKCSGFGARKADDLGESFLAVLRDVEPTG